MKKLILCLTTVTTLLMLSGCVTSDYREVSQYTIEQFLDTKAIFGSSFSFDGKTILYTSNESGIYNAYTIPVDGGTPTALTASDSNSVFSISFFPEDNRVLFLSDEGGNEIWHIFLREENGSIRDITPYNNARATFHGWSRDQKSFYFQSNKRDPRFMDVYEMDIEKFEAKLIYQNDEGLELGDISNDKRYMAFHKSTTTNNTDMYLYDRETDDIRHLTPHEGDIVYNPVAFSVDSKTLYFLTDEEREFSYLKNYDIASGGMSIVEEADWDIGYAYFSWNGKYKVVVINNDAKTEVRITDTGTGEQIKLPELPEADITRVNISKNEELMTFYLNGSRAPNNLYVFNLKTGGYTRLTESMNPAIEQNDLVDGRVIRYKSFDGVEIPSILYKPHQIKPGEKVPALVWVHGGPGGQSGVGYSATIQYFVNHGYVVLAVNNRGSSGYGKTFYKMDDRRHGQDDLDDCVMAKDFLATLGYVDTSKVGILGGSYGGYMTLAALTFRPRAFAVGVDLFGISNWVRTLESMPPWWESFKKALYAEMGDPAVDRDMLIAKSPLFHAENIVHPLMVLQGANDPRVIKPESDDIVEAVKKNGVPVEYVLFEDEGHGFVKKENQIKGYKAILKFLDTYLKGNTES